MKQILFVFFACTMATTTQAQSFRLGAKVGANLNKISGKSFDENFNLGYQIGAFAEINFNKKIGIQPEVLISQSGTKTTTFNGSLTPNTDAKLNYISIPLLLRYNIGKMVTLNLGPQYSILMNQDRTAVQNGTDAFSNGDFAMVGGASINFRYLRLYGRYAIGLNNLNQIDKKEEWKSQQLQLGIGFRFL